VSKHGEASGDGRLRGCDDYCANMRSSFSISQGFSCSEFVVRGSRPDERDPVPRVERRK
jgi:hypothetical protein